VSDMATAAEQVSSGTHEDVPEIAEVELKTLSSTALRGTAWSVGAYAGAMILRLGSNIVLSRLLVPQYFGLMTLLNTFITGLTLFSDLGLTPNIIRSPRGDDPKFLNTAWTMQVMRGFGLWICCVLLSWPFQKFYGDPRLGLLVPVIGLSVVISSFNSTSLSTLSRHLAVRQLTLMELAIQGASLVFTVAWALIDRSLWALVGGRLFSDLVRLVVSHRMIPGFRNTIQWEPKAARELFTFGKWIFFSTAFTFLASQSDRLVLGKLVSFQTLGMYGIAFALSDIPRQVIMSFSGHIVVPFVSKLAHLPRGEFFGLALRYRKNVLLFAAVILSLVVASGDQFMAHIYDIRYRDATWIVPILALGLWHTILYNTTSPCLFAIGKPQYAVVGYFFSALVIITGTPLAFYKWGLVGSVWVVALSDVPMYFVNLYGLAREGMFPEWQDLKMTLVFVFFLSALFTARYWIGPALPHPIALH
jgi:O-antigen/teichoic acid export membrane protein